MNDAPLKKGLVLKDKVFFGGRKAPATHEKKSSEFASNDDALMLKLIASRIRYLQENGLPI